MDNIIIMEMNNDMMEMKNIMEWQEMKIIKLIFKFGEPMKSEIHSFGEFVEPTKSEIKSLQSIQNRFIVKIQNKLSKFKIDNFKVIDENKMGGLLS